MGKLYEEVLKLGACDYEITEVEPLKWLQQRQSGIGGSDAGAVMGIVKQKSPLSCYVDKVLPAEVEESNNACKWGKLLEEPIRQAVWEELGGELQKSPITFVSKQYPFMRANLDGLLYYGDAKVLSGVQLYGVSGLEIKTCGREAFFDNSDSIDGIPKGYYAQVQHYMAVTGLNSFVVSAFFFDKRSLKHYVILRNEEYIKTLIEKEQAFWRHVEAKEPPEPIGEEADDIAIQELLLAGGYGEQEVLPNEYESVLREYLDIKEQCKALTEKKEALQQKLEFGILNVIRGDSVTGVKACTLGDYSLKMSPHSARRVDVKSLRDAGLYEKYSTISTSYVFSARRKKGR